MKRILLTSTALVAFAGAAAADISYSGTADFAYNNGSLDSTEVGFTSDVVITAAGSMALGNGMTASASLDLEATNQMNSTTTSTASSVSGGDISLSSDSASITYYVGGDGTGAGYLGATQSKQGNLNGVFASTTTTAAYTGTAATTNTGTFDGVETAVMGASATIGGATVSASMDKDNNYQIGVSTDFGSNSVALGFISESSAFGAQVSGSASSVDYTLAVGSNNTYGLNATTTAGGVDLTLDFGDAGWEIGASMPVGPATVGVTFDDTQAWEVSLDTSLEGVDLGFTFDNTNAWTVTAGIATNGMTVDLETDESNNWSIDATYDMGNGLTVGAGTDASSTQYAEVNYDLGGGASLAVEYGSGNSGTYPSGDSALGPDDDIADGTTVAVSFSF